MLIYSMSVSVDGFIADREGGFDWTGPSDDLFRFHLAQVGALGGYLLGRRLYEAMTVWETDPSMRVDEARNAFADIWYALSKVVFSRTLDSVRSEEHTSELQSRQYLACPLLLLIKKIKI